MTDPRPHILMFMSDQHSARFMGCAEDGCIQTPCMDRLAAEGARFANCYCNFPLCVPSRMSFLTSRHCHRLNIWSNSDSLDSNAPTLAHGLGLAGYRTVLVGRMHFIGEDQRHGFQERLLGDVSSPYLGRNRAEYRHRGYWGFEGVASPGCGTSHDLYFDQAVAMEANRIIRDHEEGDDPRPLCLVVSFYSPHDPYRIVARYFNMYKDRSDLPIAYNQEHNHPAAGAIRERFESFSEDTIRTARAAYRGKVHFIDDLMSQVSECFDESRLAEHAVRVYFSDHGDMMGEHGLWAKGGTFYDGAAKVPLIISAPHDRLPRGEVMSRPVSLLDLTPTLLELAGADPLPGADHLAARCPAG